MTNRGLTWLNALTNKAPCTPGYPDSVKVIDAPLGGNDARFICITPDIKNAYPRATQGEVGLLEGWNLAKAVTQITEAEKSSTTKTTLVAIIDVPSQAYGRREEAYGIHQALAAAANAYAKARIAGHAVIGLIVGKAMSGGFLAHGYQANRLIALDDIGCMVHAMGKEAAARITLRSVAELEKLAATIAPMAYDINNFNSLGLLWKVAKVRQADNPCGEDIRSITELLIEAKADIEKDQQRDLSCRLSAKNRQASLQVRKLMAKAW